MNYCKMMFIVLLLTYVVQISGTTTSSITHVTHPHVTHPHVTQPHVTHPHVTQPHLTKPHVTHSTIEPVVSDTFSFKYDPRTHIMAAITSRNKCYIYSMSATESTDVHTVHGIHILETKLIQMIDDTTQKYTLISHHDLQVLSPYLASGTTCNHAGWTSYKLN